MRRMGSGSVGLVAVVVAGCVAGVGRAQALPAAGSGLGEQIAALVSDPAVARAHWGVMVAGMDGTPIFVERGAVLSAGEQ